MKSFFAFILGAVLTFTAVGCAALAPVAPQIVSSGISLVQAAIQLKGIAESVKTDAATDTCSQTTAEKMEGYAKWADTIAGAVKEIEAGMKKTE